MHLSTSAVLASVVLAGQALGKCLLLRKPGNWAPKTCKPNEWIADFWRCEDAVIHRAPNGFTTLPSGRPILVEIDCVQKEPGEHKAWSTYRTCWGHDEGFIPMSCPGGDKFPVNIRYMEL
ncbi:hypothetical protein E4U42_001896 [Claviceps africana]|uniref:Uncharacterized protein n=1 Tax=Claviceps africana TaxID=83212 RepID=A0A8K0J9F3_9HYPO|nr:hypothetical protein E4U42_001896 [Claviceps africana]